MPKPASESVRNEALELRRSGWKLADIAGALDISPQVVGRWSKDPDLPSRPPKPGRSLICPDCGGKKAPAAIRCQRCRPAPLTPQEQHKARLTRYNDAELLAHWPMPVAFPP